MRPVQADSQLNLLFVAPYPPRQGGAAPSLLGLTTALQRQGQNVRVLAGITSDTRAFDETFVPQLGGVRLTRYPLPYFFYDHERIPFDWPQLRLENREIRRLLPELIEAERPDLIVAAQEPMAWHVPQIAQEFGIPCVLLLRGGPTNRMVDGSYPEAETRRWLEAFGRADRIVAVARNFEEGLRERGLDGVCTILNHVDLGRFRPAPKDERLLDELALSADQVVVVHVSKMEPRKRPLDLVLAADRLRREAADVVYVIVGEGPLLEETKATCRRLDLMHQFRFAGWIPYERMPAFFNLGDAVVQPSEWEGLSRVYLETMACGRVLIASDIPAAREVVRHEGNGLLFEKGNVEALARTIQRAVGDPALRDRVGRDARASVSSHAVERKAEEYMQVFRDVLRQT